MESEIGAFLLRQVITTACMVVTVLVLDRTWLRRFRTAEVLEGNPLAVAIVLGCMFLALSRV